MTRGARLGACTGGMIASRHGSGMLSALNL